MHLLWPNYVGVGRGEGKKAKTCFVKHTGPTMRPSKMTNNVVKNFSEMTQITETPKVLTQHDGGFERFTLKLDL